MPDCKVKSQKSKVISGFTLIELLVVITIIGILATLAVITFSSVQAKSRDARRKSDLQAVKKSLELYHADSKTFSPRPHNEWFQCFMDSEWGINGYATEESTGATISLKHLVEAGYIKSLNDDPLYSTDCTKDYYLHAQDPSAPSNPGDSFILSATLENTNDPVIFHLNCTPEPPRNYCISND